jgi:hypothetical protein
LSLFSPPTCRRVLSAMTTAPGAASAKAAKPADRVADGAVIGADQFAQILRIKLRRERRRADQVTKHDGELAAFGVDPHPSLPRLRGRVKDGIGRGGSRIAGERGDRTEQPAAMADRGDAELAQILGRQLRQNLAVDVIVAEVRRILLKPEPAQPFGQIHRARG